MTPSTTTGRPPAACIGLDVARCEIALAALAEHMPGATPSYVAIWEISCDGECPGAERGRWGGHVTVEFTDGRQPATFILDVDGDTIEWELFETVLVSVNPRSAPLAGPITDLTLGHCGVGSGIDIGGTFWDPVGVIDSTAFVLINSTDARFTLMSQTTATLVTTEGTVLQLVRHQGPKWMALCD